MLDDNVLCRTPAEGRQDVTRIPRWKYEAVSRAIRDAVQAAGPDGLPFAELPNAVRRRLDSQAIDRLGSVNWHVTTVKLEMEVAGEIARKGRAVPQMLVAR